jgi:hypothetical protein
VIDAAVETLKQLASKTAQVCVYLHMHTYTHEYSCKLSMRMQEYTPVIKVSSFHAWIMGLAVMQQFVSVCIWAIWESEAFHRRHAYIKGICIKHSKLYISTLLFGPQDAVTAGAGKIAGNVMNQVTNKFGGGGSSTLAPNLVGGMSKLLKPGEAMRFDL